MSVTVIGIVAGLLGGWRWKGPRERSADPVGDGYRLRQELRRQPGWVGYDTYRW